MSIIPQRPPDTPLLQYYATGYYPKSINYNNHKPSNAEPGAAAKMIERNRQPNQEVNIKPITQTKFSQRFYRPDKYLKPEVGATFILCSNLIKYTFRKDVQKYEKMFQTTICI